MKKIYAYLVFVLGIMVAGSGFAQTTFGPQQVIAQSETSGIASVYSADLDEDGYMDILTASDQGKKIAWYKNDGLGNFGTIRTITTDADGARSVFAVDLDGDGDLDVLSASMKDNKIAWYENDDMGDFVQQIITTIAYGASSVFAADLDGDGDMDVLSASLYDDTIAWYENDGMGNFGTQQIITTIADGAWTVYAADIDGDGDIDVLSASSGDSKIAWYENDSTGNFGPQQIITLNAYSAYSVFAVDLDGDGDIDVLSASSNDDEIAWYENDGTGSFGMQQIISTSADIARSVYAADLDGDGDLDVLSASSGDDKIAWYENIGFGNFGSEQIITTLAYGAYSVYAADLDSDGDIDVFSASINSDKLEWYVNNGNGNFDTQIIITNLTVSFAQSVFAIDLDGDGDADVLSASMYDNKIAWYENDGSGNFGPQQIITTNAKYATSVYAADLDGDGDMDVLSASYQDNKIAWYENDGSGNFGPQQIITTYANGAYSVFAADLDGDGDLDVLSASALDDKIAWYENDGLGNFNVYHLISDYINYVSIVYATDLDGDGDIEVLTASENKIYSFDNDGSGNFDVIKIVTNLVNGVSSIHVSDLDGDGNPDILSASTSPGKIAWYRNIGSGNFGPQQIISNPGMGANYIYTADFDQDGDIDLVTTSYLNSKVSWYENVGLGNFGAQQIISLDIDQGKSVFTIDLDGDGDIDVLSASQGDDKIAWHENMLYNAAISGTVFYDINQNGILEGEEFGLNFHGISVEPGSFYSYTNYNGFYICYPETAGIYTLNYNVPDNWSATTLTSYTLSVAESEISSNHNFGVFPNTLVSNVQPYLTSGINRCDWTVPYYITIANEGNIIEPLTVVGLLLDPQLSFNYAIPAPDSISTQGLLYWHINNLSFVQHTQIKVFVQGPDFNAMGDTLFNNVSVYNYDTNGIETGLSTFGYRPIVTCSYDPNDKSVSPLGIGPQNYTLMDEELFYTIRFQNTGNDTAFYVRITDVLSPHLDHNSFRIINSSHDMQTYRYPNGLVEFHFNNIMLPDSTVNEPGSHGYILYAVRPKDDLPDNTPITNSAHIFFDQNPAIVTNTIQNTMVYELPVIQGLSGVVKTLPHLTLIPNPSSYLLTIQYTSPQTQPITIYLYDLTGRLLHKETLQATLGTNNYILDMTKYSNGLYLVTLNDGMEVVSGRVVKE